MVERNLDSTGQLADMGCDFTIVLRALTMQSKSLYQSPALVFFFMEHNPKSSLQNCAIKGPFVGREKNYSGHGGYHLQGKS